MWGLKHRRELEGPLALRFSHVVMCLDVVRRCGDMTFDVGRFGMMERWGL